MPRTRGGRRALPAAIDDHQPDDRHILRNRRRRCLAFALSAIASFLALDGRAATTLAPFSQAPSTQRQQGFQGIPWGAPADAIEGKFGEAAERDDESCNDDLSRQALAAEGHDCFVIKMERYVLDGVPFSASFRFDPQSKGLDAVVLTSNLKSKNLDPRAVRRVQTECRQSFDRIVRQLAAEFPASILPHQVFEKPAAPFAKADLRAWEADGTSVTVRRSFGYTDHWKRWRRAEGCEVEVRYAAVPPDEEVLPE